MTAAALFTGASINHSASAQNTLAEPVLFSNPATEEAADLEATSFLTRPAQQSSPEQLEHVQVKQARPWEPSASEFTQLQREIFEYLFTGIELTPEQVQYLRAEIDRMYDARVALMIGSFGQDDETINAQIQAQDEEFYARIEQGLTPEQIEQMRENQARALREAGLSAE